MAKFSQNEDLQEQLQGTTGYYDECAANDLVWGIGLSMDDPDRIDRSRWRGQNLLGLALMEVYSALVTDGETRYYTTVTDVDGIDLAGVYTTNRFSLYHPCFLL